MTAPEFDRAIRELAAQARHAASKATVDDTFKSSNILAISADHTGRPHVEASLRRGLDALDTALRDPAMFNNLAVRVALERERRVVKNLANKRDAETNRLSQNPPNPYPGRPDADRFIPGPVTAILLDPELPRLEGDKLAARVVHILATTKRQTVRRGHNALAAAMMMTGPVAVIALNIAQVRATWFTILMLAAVLGSVTGAAMTYDTTRHPRYPRLSLDDACALAALTCDHHQLGQWARAMQSLNTTADYGPSFASLPTDPIEGRRELLAKLKTGRKAMAHLKKDIADASTTRPAGALTSPTPTPMPQPAAVDRERRIAQVHAAVAELDAEWLEYRLDIHAWFLSKPQLRNNDDPVIKAYRDAHAELRDLADALTADATDSQITTAQQAARRALTAWGAANTHALKIGVSDLTPSEEAALKRLHGLVATLNDRSTPKSMWADLKTAIIRTMDKLTVTSFDLDVVAALPVIAAESRLRALPAAPTAAVDEPAP